MLADLLEEYENLGQQITVLKTQRDRLHDQLEEKLIPLAQEKLKKTGVDAGTVHIHLADDDMDVSLTLPKKITWDSAMLESLMAHIIPPAIIRKSFDVSETVFKQLPTDMQHMLLPARTTKMGRLTIKRGTGETSSWR